MERRPQSMSRQLVQKIGQALEQDEEHRKIVATANITEADRNIVRSKLLEASEHIRQTYHLEIPVIRSFLHEMLEVL